MSAEDDYLMLSGLQHYYFCKRQWALIHIEQAWKENLYTTEGQNLHEKTDNPFIKEKRRDIIISRAVPIASSKLKLSGIIDTIEFYKDLNGITINNKKGKWWPNIVEYKRGKPKKDNRDKVQLMAQAMCLEEELGIKLKTSDLYYFQTNRREVIDLNEELRKEVYDTVKDMHLMYDKKITPSAEFFKNCTLCSLYDLCMPRLTKKKNLYIII